VTDPAGTGSNVLAVLRDVARRVPDRPALVMGGGRTISFARLWERIDRASVGLRQREINPGDRAIVMIPMSIDLYVALLALLKIGAVAVFVDPWIGRRQIAAFAAFAEPRAYLGIPRSHLLRWLEPALRKVPLSVTTGRRLAGLPARTTLAELEDAPGDGWICPAGPDDSALITFTSGSSGEPKGADRTHGFLLAQHRALAEAFPVRNDEADMPMFPIFALNNLALGVTSVVPQMDFRRVERVDPAPVLAQMASRDVRTCTASPPFFDRLAPAIRAAGGRVRLRRILTGGAPVSDAQLRAWRRDLPDTEIVVAYGSTEAEPVAHLAAEERLETVSDVRPRTPGFCAGRPIDRIQARVIRIHPGPVELGEGGWADWEVPRGEIGELAVTGEHVCKSYYRNPKAVAENKIVDRNAPGGTVWHRMGDTGYLDGDGRFWLCGRVHSTIRRAGQEIHPQLVEQAARGEDPRIRRLAAVGLPDPALGERVVLVLETETGEDDTLQRDVTDRLAAAGLAVDEIRITRVSLPVDPRHNSKIDYGRLREDLLR
jgi:acyl-CoA synthetase (AMP-forming)/AMP-acid ligase II